MSERINSNYKNVQMNPKARKDANKLEDVQMHGNARKIANKFENVPEQYLEIAEGMETQFINHMLGEMRKTVHTAEKDDNATAYYKSMMDYERAKIMSKTENGIGLKDIILDQIYPKHMRVDMPAMHAINTYRQQEVDSTKGDGNE